MISGQCLKPKETRFHNNPEANGLIKEIAHRFYRSPNFACPGKEAFVALSTLNQVLTSSPIPGAGDGIALSTLIAPSSVNVGASGFEPRLPVSCGYNNEAATSYRASFFCTKSGACYQQGDDSLPHDCEAFAPAKKGIGVQFWEHRGGDCSNVRRFQNGGEEGTFALRELGPGIFIRIVQDNWDDAFYHGLIFSKDPSVIEFWRSDEE